MASNKQHEANRANAKNSTGPRTQTGKARSRLNSRKHGLAAKTLIIVGEHADDFDELLAALMDEHDPQSFPLKSAEAELLEDTTHHEVNGFGTGACALQGRPEIDVSHLDDAVGAINAQESGKTAGVAGSLIYDGMKHRIAARRERDDPGFTGCGVRRPVVGHVGPLARMGRHAEAAPQSRSMVCRYERSDPTISALHECRWGPGPRRPAWNG
jgi:hypothetical protein